VKNLNLGYWTPKNEVAIQTYFCPRAQALEKPQSSKKHQQRQDPCWNTNFKWLRHPRSGKLAKKLQKQTHHAQAQKMQQ